jgi:hypothetical protein
MKTIHFCRFGQKMPKAPIFVRVCSVRARTKPNKHGQICSKLTFRDFFGKEWDIDVTTACNRKHYSDLRVPLSSGTGPEQTWNDGGTGI